MIQTSLSFSLLSQHARKMESEQTAQDFEENIKKYKSKWCSAINCTNSKIRCPDLAFFSFPLDAERSRRWVINSRRADLEKKAFEKLHRSNVICEIHFEPSCFKETKGKRTLLKKDAVPSIFAVPNPPPKQTLSRPPPKERTACTLSLATTSRTEPDTQVNDVDEKEIGEPTDGDVVQQENDLLKRKLFAERSKNCRLKKKLKTCINDKELDESSTNSEDDEKNDSPSVQPGSDAMDENSMENNANNGKVNNNNNDSDSLDCKGMEEIPEKFKHQLKHQELFLSRQVETLPATHIRGKCCVTLLNETESLLSYLNKDDTFVYSLLYGRPQKTFLADKGEIRVGSKYQADSIPLVLAEADYDRKSEDLEELVWDPNHKLTEKEIDQFQIIARSVGTYARALDCTSTARQPSLHMSAATASRDITIFHAMETLHQQRYDLTKAIKSLVPSGGPVLCRDEMEEWTASEANLFEDAIEKYGKDFNDILQDFLPWKSMKSIIEYYYLWKTTDRYVQQKRLKASKAKESKLKEVYIPNYKKPNPASITSKMNGLDNQVSGRVCESENESCYKS